MRVSHLLLSEPAELFHRVAEGRGQVRGVEIAMSLRWAGGKASWNDCPWFCQKLSVHSRKLRCHSIMTLEIFVQRSSLLEKSSLPSHAARLDRTSFTPFASQASLPIPRHLNHYDSILLGDTQPLEEAPRAKLLEL